MQLDDLKNTWQAAGNPDAVKEGIPVTSLNALTEKRMFNILKKIAVPEILGSLVCLGSAIFIILNFYRLNTVAFQVTGIITAALFVILPAISIISIYRFYSGSNVGKSYAETLKDFTTKKIRFNKLQKLNLTLCYLLFVSVALLLTRLFGRSPVTESKYFFILTYSAGYILLAVFSKWVFKSYNRTIRETELLLHEL